MMFGRLTAMTGLLLAGAMACGCVPQTQQPLAPLPSPALDFAPAPTPVRTATPQPRAVEAPVGEAGWAVQGTARPWRFIVIHHSATERGNAESFDRDHRNRGFDELGYHFVITNGDGGPDGQVQVGSRWRRQKWGAHCGGTEDNEYNNYGIGICLVGNFERGMPTAGQLASLRRLMDYLVATYDISPANVIGHRDAPCAETACPGARLEAYINNTLRPALVQFARRHADSGR